MSEIIAGIECNELNEIPSSDGFSLKDSALFSMGNDYMKSSTMIYETIYNDI